MPGVSSMRSRKKSQWLSMRDIFLREETGFEPDTSTARRSRSTISASTYIFQIYMNAEKYFWNGQIGAWTISVVSTEQGDGLSDGRQRGDP